MKSNMKLFGLLLTTVIIASGIFGACENPAFADMDTSTKKVVDKVVTETKPWEPEWVVMLKTKNPQAQPQLGTLSLMPTGDSAGSYRYRLHIDGDVFSGGTVTVTDNGTTFAFVSEGGKTFGGTISGGTFTFVGEVSSDEGEARIFEAATVTGALDKTGIPADSVTLDNAGLELNTSDHDTATLTATIHGANADTQLWWSSSKPGVAKVAPNEGGLSATITALARAGVADDYFPHPVMEQAVTVGL